MNFYRKKLVFIAGGSSGIGLAMSEIIAASGGSVVIFARDREKMMSAAVEEYGAPDVFLSSLAGLIAIPGYSLYGAGKSAVLGMAGSLRAEVRRYGIKVCVACPPEVDTPLIESERKTISPGARAVKSMTGTLSAESVAKSILRGIASGRFLVIPGWRARAVYIFNRISPALSRLTADYIFKLKDSRK